MGGLPFGLVCGFAITALPFLLSKAGVSVDRIATVSAVASSPLFWAFLMTPVVDVGLARRAYAFALAIVSAVCLAAALWTFSPDRLPLFTALMLVAQLAAVLQNNAVLGWISQFVPDGRRGKASAWLNAANLGGGATGAMLIMGSAAYLSFPALGAMVAVVVLATTLALFRFPPANPALDRGPTLSGTLRSIVQTSRQPLVLTGFVLFLAPASCAAAINLFAALGDDFHTSAQWVIWITGAGAAITGTLGSLLGGHIADHVDRGALYMSGGMLAGLIALLMAWTPHTPATFAVGVLVYNCAAGVCYAGCTALCLQLLGTANPAAATQIALFFAASNVPIVYMTWLDGRGYAMFGVRGLLLVDGLVSIGAAIPLLLYWRRCIRATSIEPSDA
jgi:predicted MFS family arabinose efflux permease